MSHPLGVASCALTTLSRRCVAQFVSVLFSLVFQCFRVFLICVLTGCAFVTFTSKQCAINAIKAMHHSQTMEVSFAASIWGTYFFDAIKKKKKTLIRLLHNNLLWEWLFANGCVELVAYQIDTQFCCQCLVLLSQFNASLCQHTQSPFYRVWQNYKIDVGKLNHSILRPNK